MRKYLLILLFITTISTPFIIGLMHNNIQSVELVFFDKTQDKAILKKFTSFLNNVKINLKKVEKKFSNDFILKNRLTKFYFYLKQNPIPNRAVAGEKGWLYVGNDDYSNSILESKNIINFSNREIKILKTKINKLHKWFSNNDIDFYIAVPPNKLSVYGEFLPVIGNPKQRKKSEQLGSVCEQLGVKHLNMLDGIVVNNDEPLFLKTDSHWNDMGAYIGYKNLIEKMKLEHPNLNIIPIDSLNKKSKILQKQDLARMLKKNVPEKTTIFEIKNSKAKKIKNQLQVPKTYSYKPDTYEQRFKSDVNNLKVLIFRDSFTNALMKFIKETFGETVFIWQNRLDKEIILKEKPDIVISICVERNIDVFKFM